MPVLAFQKPVRTAEPQLLVENELEPGSYRFRLVVIDDSGNESVPNDLIVQVRPVRVLDPDRLRDRITERLGGRLNPTIPNRRVEK